MDNPLLELHTLGQRIWLDNLSRTLLKEGGLQRLITENGLVGVTSNPTIFFKARQVFADLGRYGILMGKVGDELQVEGVKLFQQSFDQLMALMA